MTRLSSIKFVHVPLKTIAADAPITAKNGEYSGLPDDILSHTVQINIKILKGKTP